MPMQYLPHLANIMDYVSTCVVEQLWKDKLMWLWETSQEGNESASFVFPLLVHPDVTSMAHIIGMVDRFLQWLQGFGESVKFCTCEDVATAWLEVKKEKANRQ